MKNIISTLIFLYNMLKATSRRALSKPDLQKLIRYQPAPLSKEENAKYFFLFSNYQGNDGPYQIGNNRNLPERI